jgi:hypothetical protein
MKGKRRIAWEHVGPREVLIRSISIVGENFAHLLILHNISEAAVPHFELLFTTHFVIIDVRFECRVVNDPIVDLFNLLN